MVGICSDGDSDPHLLRFTAVNIVEIKALESEFDPHAIRVETVPVRPRKSDIAVTDLALVWAP